MSQVEIVQERSAFDSTDWKNLTARCPAGKRAIGGGAIGALQTGVVYDGGFVTHSDPGFSSWRAGMRENNPTTVAWRLSVYVICAKTS